MVEVFMKVTSGAFKFEADSFKSSLFTKSRNSGEAYCAECLNLKCGLVLVHVALATR